MLNIGFDHECLHFGDTKMSKSNLCLLIAHSIYLKIARSSVTSTFLKRINDYSILLLYNNYTHAHAHTYIDSARGGEAVE